MTIIAKVVAASLLALLSTAAFAEQGKPATKPIPASYDWSVCKANIEKFCKGVDGNENIYLCLQEHDDDLSKACDVSHTAYEVLTGRK